jgi:hypothetical protein
MLGVRLVGTGGVLSLASLIAAAIAAACVFEDPPIRPLTPCERVECSVDGFCDDGVCFCNRGYVGDPYATHGCQLPGACETTCGLNSFCENGACVCAEGFSAVCGTGDCLADGSICDGTPDCPNGADEHADVCARSVILDVVVVDACDDGLDIEWRLYSGDKAWVWPGVQSVFITRGLDVESFESVDCLQGEELCFGAAAGDNDWGIGLEGTLMCETCCFVCADQSIDLGELACD